MAENLSLNINVDILKKLDEADKKLQQIATHSEEVSKAMKKLSTDGINSVVNSLTQMNTTLTKLAQNNSLANVGTQANQSVDAINKMIAALAQLTNQQQLRLQTQQAKLDYKKEANDIKELAVAENERSRALDRQNKANAANDKHRQALETKRLANDTKELMNIEQERGRQLILQNQKNIAAYTKQSVKLKQQINEINRLAKAYQQMPTKLKQVDLNKIITSASKAKTINQHIVAIHNLQNALRDLDTTSKKYKDNVKKINEEITRNKIELAKLGVSLDSVKRKKRQLMDTVGQLQRSLALVFSISHISGYINKLVNIRREMELQHRSLQVLIQDRFKADELWQQTVDLAVRSPFRVKELVTYTRQLAAYRIETDRLHDTTRRLADVSAGLGVDMNRLILAYGQVRAAEYLRGTELRQFSEAGIPMLDELAKHFEQLEGRAVSAGDVFERVSKRMVSFEDVDEVFQRMTNKGGVFFQMQEKQSETLHGIISNLHDSVDLMLNDIGEANDGFLKGTVLLFRGFVQNWRAFAEILTQIGTAAVIISLYRGISKLVALSPKIYAMAGAFASLGVANNAINVSIKRFIVSIKALGAAMLTPQGIILGLVATIASAISGFVAWGKAVDAANAKFDKMSEREVHSINELNKLNEKIKENNKIIEDNNSKLEEKTKAEEDNAKTLELLKNKYPDVYKGLVAQKNGTIDASKAVEHYNEMLRVNIALQQQAKGGKFQDTFSENYEAALADYQKVVSGITRVQSQALQGIVNATSLLQKGSIRQGTFDSITKILGKLSNAETFEDLKLLNNELVAFQNTLLSNQREYATIIKSTASLREAYSDLYSSQGSYIDSLDDWYGNIDNQMDAFIVGVQKKIALAANETIGKSLAGDWVTGELKKLGAVNEELLKKAQKYVKSKLPLGIDVTFEEKGKPVYNLEESWREKIWSAIEAVQASNPDIRLGVTLEEMATKDKSELIRKIQESVVNAMDINDKTIEGIHVPFQVVFTDEQIQNAKNAKPLLEFLAQLVAINKEGNKSSTKDWWSEMAKGIQNLRKDFVDLNETFDENESKQIALERHLGVLKEIIANLGDKGKGIDIGSINFTTEQGTIDALTALKKMLPESAKQARVSIEKALSDITGTMRISDKELKDQKLIDKIEEMFSGYEMSIELQNINIPEDLANKLFKIDYTSLPQLRENIVKMKPLFDGKKMEKVYNEFMKRIDEAEKKQQVDRLKRFAEFLSNTADEISKIQNQGAFDITYAKDLFSKGAINAEEYSTIVKNVVDNVNESVSKINLEKFKNSPEYIAAMGDMAGYTISELDTLAEKIKKLIADNAKPMSPEEIKAYLDALKRINDETEKITSPFGDNWIQEIKEIKELENQLNKEKDKQKRLNDSLVTQQGRLVTLQKKLDDLKAQPPSKENTKQIGETLGEIQKVQQGISDTNGELNTTAGNISSIGSKLQTLLGNMGSSVAIVDKIVHGVSQSINATITLFNDFKEMFDSFGVDTDSGTWQDVTLAMETLGKINQKATQGWEDLKSGNIAGAVANTIGVVTTLITGLNKIHDAKYERQIQREIKFIEDLEYAYNKLEKAIDNAYSINKLKSSGANANRNLESQIDSYEKMIAAEEAKKDTDKERIKEWQQSIEELIEKKAELDKELISTVTGGIMDDVLSASKDFTDAWLDAFKETGDGLNGLESNFKETMLEMVKQQAAMLISQAYVDRWKKQLEQYINPTDLELSTGEAKKWVDAVTTSLPQLNDALEKYFTAMQQAGVDINGSGELSGLQRGIQGVTEETAQIIEAYLNSIRFFVAEQNTYLSQIAATFGNTEVENPMVEQLRIIAAQTSAINSLLQGLVRGGHSLGGTGLKVFIS